MSSAARSAAVRRPAAARPAATRPAAARPQRTRPRLSAVPAPSPAVAGNGVFALVVVAVLVGGMVLLLVLNTSLAQGAFEISSLTKQHNALAVQEQELLQDVARAEAPASLQRRADALGMVPVTSPVFLRLADGAVLGVPKPAVRATPLARTGAPVGGPAATTAARTAPAPSAAASRTDAARPDAVPASDAAQPDPASTP